MIHNFTRVPFFHITMFRATRKAVPHTLTVSPSTQQCLSAAAATTWRSIVSSVSTFLTQLIQFNNSGPCADSMIIRAPNASRTLTPSSAMPTRRQFKLPDAGNTTPHSDPAGRRHIAFGYGVIFFYVNKQTPRSLVAWQPPPRETTVNSTSIRQHYYGTNFLSRLSTQSESKILEPYDTGSRQ